MVITWSGFEQYIELFINYFIDVQTIILMLNEVLIVWATNIRKQDNKLSH